MVQEPGQHVTKANEELSVPFLSQISEIHLATPWLEATAPVSTSQGVTVACLPQKVKKPVDSTVGK